MYELRFDSPVDATEFIFDRQEAFQLHALQAQAASVAGAGLRLSTATVSLNAAASQLLRAASGALQSGLTAVPWEFYNDPSSTVGAPADSGTFNIDGAGEVVVSIDGVSLENGGYGQLIVYHPTDPDIRGTYRLAVTIT